MKRNNLILESTSGEIVLGFLKKIIKNTEWENNVFAVGGCVRDEIMGLKSKDLDFVVNGDLNSGINFSIWLSAKLNNYKNGSNPVIYPRFGTSKLSLLNNKYNLPNIDLEFVAPRKEKYKMGDRKPDVTGGDLVDEVNRRDLTINSLLKNVSTEEILDLTGNGIDDIKNGVIRTPINPNITFSEDALRLLRAVRFSTKYGFKINDDVFGVIKKNAHIINTISKERIQDELNKILVLQNPDIGIKMLQSTGLLKHIIPDLDKTVGMNQGKHHTEDVFTHILSVVKNTPPDLNTRLMAMFHDIGKISTRTIDPDGSIHFYDHEKIGAEMTRNIMMDLKYSNDIINAVSQGVSVHMRLKNASDSGNEVTDKTLRKFSTSVGENLGSILDLIHADNISHKEESAMPNQVKTIKDRLDDLKFAMNKGNITLPINGNDILGMGIPQGQLVGQVKDAIQDAWYENPDISREEAIDIVNQFKVDNNLNEIRNLMKKLI